MNSFFKIFEHIFKGTLLWRIKNHSSIEHERRWIKFQQSNEPFLITQPWSFKIKLYRNDLLTRAIYFKEFESKEINFLKDYLSSEDVFVDVGGNIGLFTLLAASKIKKTGAVYTFEPSTENFKKLTENIALNNFVNVKAYCLGLSDKSEKRILYHVKNGFGALSSFVPPDNSEFESIDSNVTSLSEFVKKESIEKIDAIKIDVEGWEKPVIMGAQEILTQPNSPLLIVEFTDENARSAGFSCQEVYDQLKEFGYSMFRISNDMKLVKEEKKDYYTYTNLICVKNGSEAYNRVKALIA